MIVVFFVLLHFFASSHGSMNSVNILHINCVVRT